MLLIVTSCQPRYVIIPIPSNPSAGETTSIKNISELRIFLEKSGNGKAIVNSLIIDPTVENLPITVNGIKEIEGSLQVGNTPSSSAYSINLLADTGEQTNVPTAVFYVPAGAAMNLNNLSATISEEAVSSVSALIEVDTGNISLDNVSITVPDSVNTTQFSTIKTTENTKSDNISISDSDNVSVFIPENNTDESLKEEIESNGTAIATPYDSYSADEIISNLTEYGKARLVEDLSITSEVFNLTPADSTEFETLILDLNKHNLSIKNTLTDTSSSVLTDLEIMNGNMTVNITSNNLAASCISIASDAHLTFTNVDYHASHTGIFLSEDGTASFTATDSEIISDGGYGIGTNAQNSPITSYVDLSNTIVRTDDPSGTAGILFNSKGTLKITNGSEIEGSQQAVVGRGGDITISDSKLFCNGGFVVSNETQYRYTSDWGQGNDVPYATLVVGNRSASDAYDYPTTCTVSNTEITMEINEGNSKATQIYISSDDDNTVTLKIDNNELAANIETGKHYWGLKTYVNEKQMPVDESGNPSDSITK